MQPEVLEKKPTRKSSTHLRVPVLPKEADVIKAHAAQVNLSVAAYLRQLGLGYEPKSTIDRALIAELAKINADQGRLGGLLKMWLSNKERLLGFDGEKTKATLKAVLEKIEKNQTLLLEIAQKAK
ncbi:MAG: conjugal transfer transcriptional regulator TraJ [Endozoicomonas sp. (ex Botrylloides leachii)]|nr:conjugal transfer transcriptional regulator TraJ [Endozoicomonas sp. (ex Botrylloides leachii)]